MCRYLLISGPPLIQLLFLHELENRVTLMCMSPGDESGHWVSCCIFPRVLVSHLQTRNKLHRNINREAHVSIFRHADVIGPRPRSEAEIFTGKEGGLLLPDILTHGWSLEKSESCRALDPCRKSRGPFVPDALLKLLETDSPSLCTLSATAGEVENHSVVAVGKSVTLTRRGF